MSVAFEAVASAEATVTENNEVTLTVVESNTEPTFAVGDKVRIADEASTKDGGWVDPAAYGQVGEITSLQWADTYGPTVRYHHRLTHATDVEYIGPQYLTKLTETEVLQLEVESLRSEVQSLTEARDAATELVKTERESFEQWKDNLREVALQAAEENDFCRVFDDVMEKVGLRGREREITLMVSFEGSVPVTVTATSIEEAQEMIGKDEIKEAIADAPSWRGNPIEFYTVPDDEY